MLFSRLETLLIALALIVPETLRTCSRNLEPYPAVILPKGAGTIRIKRGKTAVDRTYLTAKRNGAWEEVNVRKFMAPIAEHYFGRVARRGFGLASATALDPEGAAATKRWMKAKLGAQGFDTGQLRVVTERITVSLPGKATASRVTRRKNYDLD